MIKKIKAIVKLALPAGKVTAAPPVGPVLGQHGVNIAAFCKEYNAKTIDRVGLIIPAKITIYEDRSYSFILKTPPTSVLLQQRLKINKGSSEPNKIKIGTITSNQLREIAEIKMVDLNTDNIDAAIRIIEGTARNMGLTISN